MNEFEMLHLRTRSEQADARLADLIERAEAAADRGLSRPGLREIEAARFAAQVAAKQLHLARQNLRSAERRM